MPKQKDNSKPKAKAIKLPETEKEDEPITSKDIKAAQDFARSVSPFALAMFEAKSEQKKKDE